MSAIHRSPYQYVLKLLELRTRVALDKWWWSPHFYDLTLVVLFLSAHLDRAVGRGQHVKYCNAMAGTHHATYHLGGVRISDG